MLEQVAEHVVGEDDAADALAGDDARAAVEAQLASGPASARTRAGSG
jgi:hypothetical protein